MKPTFDSWYWNKMNSSKELTEETERVRELLGEIRTIAVVGVSKSRHRDSHYVASYLQRAGYRIIPVNPTAEEILGERAYPNLTSVQEPIDVVDIFRKPDDVHLSVDEAIPLKPRAVWLQLGTGSHPELADQVKGAGIMFIQNRCMKVDHQFLIRG